MNEPNIPKLILGLSATDDRAMNQRIAETLGLCIPDWRFNGAGYVCAKCNQLDYERGRQPKHPEVPDYFRDLNAMHAAEEWLESHHPNKCMDYSMEVRFLINKGKSVGMFRYIHATAAQRAEAFLRTIGKWKESEAKDRACCEVCGERLRGDEAIRMGVCALCQDL